MEVSWIQEIINFVDIPSDIFSGEVVHEPTQAVSHVDGEDNEYQTLKKLQLHPYFHFNIKLAAPVFVLPGKSSLVVELGMFHLVSCETKEERDLDNVETFYDRFKLELSDLSIKLGDGYVCEPISLAVEIGHSFIHRKSIAMTKVSVSLDSVVLKLDKHQVNMLMGMADDFTVLAQGPKSETPRSAPKGVSEKVVIQETKSELSLGFSFVFQQMKVILIKDDASLLTEFAMTLLQTNLSMIGSSISCHAELDDVMAMYGEKPILSVEKTDGKCFQMQFDYTVDESNVVLTCLKPTAVLDISLIMDLKEYFTVPEKLMATLSPDDGVVVAETKIIVQTERPTRPIPKIKANINVTDAVLSMVLVGRSGPIVLESGIGALKANIPESQKGFVEMNSFRLKIDDRYVVEPFSARFDVTVKPHVQLSMSLDEIVGVVDVKDCQMMMEMKDYFVRKAMNKTTEDC